MSGITSEASPSHFHHSFWISPPVNPRYHFQRTLADHSSPFPCFYISLDHWSRSPLTICKGPIKQYPLILALFAFHVNIHLPSICPKICDALGSNPRTPPMPPTMRIATARSAQSTKTNRASGSLCFMFGIFVRIYNFRLPGMSRSV
jgi:hypothetical protein